MAALADELDFDAGHHLVRGGEFGYEVFAIEAGRVEVTHDDQCLADLGPGDFFGELAVMGLMRRTRRSSPARQ